MPPAAVPSSSTPSSVANPSPQYLIVFNQTLKPSSESLSAAKNDENVDVDDLKELAQILCYLEAGKPGEVEDDKQQDVMLRRLGLAKGLMGLTDMMAYKPPSSEQVKAENFLAITSARKRYILWSPEPDFWIHVVVETAPEPALAQGKTATTDSPKARVKSGVDSGVKVNLLDAQLKAWLQRGQAQYLLKNGPLALRLEAGLRGQELKDSLQLFWNEWIGDWDISKVHSLREWIGGYPKPPPPIASFTDSQSALLKSSSLVLLTPQGPLSTLSPPLLPLFLHLSHLLLSSLPPPPTNPYGHLPYLPRARVRSTPREKGREQEKDKGKEKEREKSAGWKTLGLGHMSWKPILTLGLVSDSPSSSRASSPAPTGRVSVPLGTTTTGKPVTAPISAPPTPKSKDTTWAETFSSSLDQVNSGFAAGMAPVVGGVGRVISGMGMGFGLSEGTKGVGEVAAGGEVVNGTEPVGEQADTGTQEEEEEAASAEDGADEMPGPTEPAGQEVEAQAGEPASSPVDVGGLASALENDLTVQEAAMEEDHGDEEEGRNEGEEEEVKLHWKEERVWLQDWIGDEGNWTSLRYTIKDEILLALIASSVSTPPSPSDLLGLLSFASESLRTDPAPNPPTDSKPVHPTPKTLAYDSGSLGVQKSTTWVDEEKRSEGDLMGLREFVGRDKDVLEAFGKTVDNRWVFGRRIGAGSEGKGKEKEVWGLLEKKEASLVDADYGLAPAPLQVACLHTSGSGKSQETASVLPGPIDSIAPSRTASAVPLKHHQHRSYAQLSHQFLDNEDNYLHIHAALGRASRYEHLPTPNPLSIHYLSPYHQLFPPNLGPTSIERKLGISGPFLFGSSQPTPTPDYHIQVPLRLPAENLAASTDLALLHRLQQSLSESRDYAIVFRILAELRHRSSYPTLLTHLFPHELKSILSLSIEHSSWPLLGSLLVDIADSKSPELGLVEITLGVLLEQEHEKTVDPNFLVVLLSSLTESQLAKVLRSRTQDQRRYILRAFLDSPSLEESISLVPILVDSIVGRYQYTPPDILASISACLSLFEFGDTKGWISILNSLASQGHIPPISPSLNVVATNSSIILHTLTTLQGLSNHGLDVSSTLSTLQRAQALVDRIPPLQFSAAGDEVVAQWLFTIQSSISIILARSTSEDLSALEALFQGQHAHYALLLSPPLLLAIYEAAALYPEQLLRLMRVMDSKGVRDDGGAHWAPAFIWACRNAGWEDDLERMTTRLEGEPGLIGAQEKVAVLKALAEGDERGQGSIKGLWTKLTAEDSVASKHITSDPSLMLTLVELYTRSSSLQDKQFSTSIIESFIPSALALSDLSVSALHHLARSFLLVGDCTSAHKIWESTTTQGGVVGMEDLVAVVREVGKRDREGARRLIEMGRRNRSLGWRVAGELLRELEVRREAEQV